MNEKVLKTLEFDKIIGMLTEKCLTPIGKETAAKLTPLSEIAEIETAQQETEDAFHRLVRYGSVSCSGARDIRPSLLRLKIEANLNQAELLNIEVLLKAAFRVKKYGEGDENTEEHDSLENYFNALRPLVTFEKTLERCIISEEEMADDASPKLASIRRKIAASESKIHSELNSIVMSHGNYLRENVITMRNGRYCIPVRAEFRSQVAGTIHDESGSGSTVFIEPQRIIQMNNEIRELEIEEKKEIDRILAELSAEAYQYRDDLKIDLETLSHLDFVFAKASLARDMDATRPEFNTKHRIVLKKARHPLLERRSCVPIDLSLGRDFTELIVTGPNTGGKTVSLKTVGLLSLMGQSGLHIPASASSELSVFHEIYADIGDEQSIEQSLSTFSSHMKNIITILSHVDEHCLVLLDELCAGTDPNEGAALAIAILKYLLDLGVDTMATTHYSEIKLYALSTDDVENASCEFDVATLSPTYRLLIGIPGKSNAFAISKKLGLPDFLIDDAKGRIDSESERFEDVIKNLDDSRKNMEIEQLEVARLRKEASMLKETLAKQEAKIEAERDRILKAARAEARELLQGAKDRVDETIRQIHKSGSTAGVRDLENERTLTREMLDGYTERREKGPKQKSQTEAKDLHIGDGVMVLSMNLKGTVSTLPDAKGNLFVQMGILRSQVHVSDVEKLKESTVSYNGTAGVPKEKGGRKMDLSRALNISTEINLIGLTVDEAIPKLDKYLDDAYMSHLPSVRIVHGRGTGALKNAVHRQLKRYPYIDEFHLGVYGEGDTGVTIVTFK